MEIYDMFYLQTQAKSIDLIFSISEGMPEEVTTDARRLKQVIINLLSNALKFTMQGSIQLNIDFEKENNLLSVSVKDTGIGIRKNH